MNVTEIDGVFHCDCGFSWQRGKSGAHDCAVGLRAQRDQLAADKDAMAAEVQAVRWACGQVYITGYNHGHLNTVDGLPYADEKDLVMRGGEVLYEFTDPDHCGVAVDAILAEVRAQGVDMVRELWESERNLVSQENIAQFDFAMSKLQLMAIKLRNGEAV